MPRYLPYRFNSRVFHRGGWVEAFSDGLGDEGRPLFLKKFDQPLLFLDKGIDLCRLAVKESCNAYLLINWRKAYGGRPKIFSSKNLAGCPFADCRELSKNGRIISQIFTKSDLEINVHIRSKSNKVIAIYSLRHVLGYDGRKADFILSLRARRK